ncbi:hypothetical protein DMH12_02310 [Streptomyces sp. WAC 04229]|uniref:autoinducer binding domain-containing protein n=1 Tax=Streptomyces sp. WAC 04229 TaxID=2203206 RepID=UPI000F7472EA|nr:hypothetical protein DMH12_02310 [Streptomyces sp. WAC 04229]
MVVRQCVLQPVHRAALLRVHGVPASREAVDDIQTTSKRIVRRGRSRGLPSGLSQPLVGRRGQHGCLVAAGEEGAPEVSARHMSPPGHGLRSGAGVLVGGLARVGSVTSRLTPSGAHATAGARAVAVRRIQDVRGSMPGLVQTVGRALRMRPASARSPPSRCPFCPARRDGRHRAHSARVGRRPLPPRTGGVRPRGMCDRLDVYTRAHAAARLEDPVGR